MTIQEALDVLRRGATRSHGVQWGLTDPHGEVYVAGACSCVRHSLTTAEPPSDDLPCDCGARDWNAKVKEAVLVIQAAMVRLGELFEVAAEQPCLCGRPFVKDCPHCEAVIEARNLLNADFGFQNPDGN
jgi:hypothetical protein